MAPALLSVTAPLYVPADRPAGLICRLIEVGVTPLGAESDNQPELDAAALKAIAEVDEIESGTGEGATLPCTYEMLKLVGAAVKAGRA